MARISQSRGVKMASGLIMTIVMVISLFTGIGAIWVNEETKATQAGGTAYNAGKYTVPESKAGAAKGTADNPYVVLEIVPDASRAQFGYLVGGQEPVDLEAIALAPNATSYATMLSRYLNLDVTNMSTTVSEFDLPIYQNKDLAYTVGGENKTVKKGGEGFIWKSGTATTQYGEYKYNTEDIGEYALVEEKITEPLGYVVKMQADADDSIPERYKLSELTAELLATKKDTSAEAINTITSGKTEGTDFFVDGTNYYVKVPETTGLYSSRRYDYVGENSGPYSLLYKYMGNGGDKDIEITLPEITAYTTRNIFSADNQGRRVGYYPQTGSNQTYLFYDEGKFVGFRRIRAGEDTTGIPTYSIKEDGYSNHTYGNYSDPYRTWNKYYEGVSANATDYDIAVTAFDKLIETFYTRAQSKYNDLDKLFYKTENVNGTNFTRNDIKSNDKNKPEGYDQATNIGSIYWSKDVLKYDKQYFYYYDGDNKRYYKYEYKTGSTKAKDYIVEYLKIEYRATKTDADFGKYYVVLFEYDPDGKFVVDTNAAKSDYNQYDKHMTYTTKTVNSGEEGKWEWIDKANGAYKDLTKIKPGTSQTYADADYNGIPQPVFRNVTEKANGRTMEGLKDGSGNPLKVHLGEYTEHNYLELHETMPTDESVGTTTIYTKDYQRYTVIPVFPDDENVYKYTIESAIGVTEVEDRIKVLATYDWHGYDLEESIAISSNDEKEDADANNLKDEYEPNRFLYVDGYPKQFTESTPAVIYGNKTNQPTFIGYLGGYTNYELFKYYSLGLAYNNNLRTGSIETAAYEFVEWCSDPAGIYPFSASTPIYSGITLYAKWLIKYPEDITDGTEWNGFTVKFDPNLPAGETQVDNMPGLAVTTGEGESQITEYLVKGINRDALISAPANKPACKMHMFKGWYKDSACTQAFNFSSDKITADTTIYAGWEAISSFDSLTKYTFTLDSNLSSGYMVVMPAETTISNVALNGKRYSDEGGTLTASNVSITNPTCTSDTTKTFIGWYLDRAGNTKFEFTPENMEKLLSNSVILYAKWISNDPLPTCRVSFNANKPSGAIGDVTGLETVIVNSGQGLPAAARPTAKLAGNIDQKIKDYKVQVITVTPRDFNDTHWNDNKGLIDRADLIVINETCEPGMDTLCDSFHSSSTEWYNDHHSSSVTKFAQNDLSWNAVMKIYSRITGFVYNSSTKENEKVANGTCPVLFDYKIIENCLEADKNKDVTVSGNNANGNNLSSGSQKGKSSNDNVYKLYLMTQVASPVTIYNAYFAGRTSRSISNGSLSGLTDDAATYWNPYTLVPYNVLSISQADWNDNSNTYQKRKDALALVGFDTNIGMDAATSSIRNRIFIYNSYTTSDTKKNLVSDFQNNVKLKVKKASELGYVKNILDGVDEDSVTATETSEYKARDIFYFMIHGDTIYQNLNRDINILEIQPASYSHSDEYWFWYVSNFMPDITGKIIGHPMSSLEFQCNIDDLNSKYDIIFFGTQDEIRDLSGNLITRSVYIDDGWWSGHYETRYASDEMKTVIAPNATLAYYHTGNEGTHSYYSVGSFNTVNSSTGAISNDDYTVKGRYSGNDLTFVKYKHICEFLKAGYPIIFDDGFFAKDGSKTIVNKNKIDSASWIYKLAKELIEDHPSRGNYYNWFKEGTDEAKAFREALLHKTFKLKLDKGPVEYKDKTKDSTLTDADIYINGGNPDKNRELSFTIHIESAETDKEKKKNERFRVKLFIDSNGDGKIDINSEFLDNLDVYSGGNYLGSSKNVDLEADKQYTVKRKLTDDYAGLIPWRLQAVSLDVDHGSKETEVRDEWTGLSAIQISQRAKIYVLQVVSEHGSHNSNSFGDNTVYLPTDGEIRNAYEQHGNKTIDQYIAQSGKTYSGYFKYDKSGSLYNNIGKKSSNYLYENAAKFYMYTYKLSEFEVHFLRTTASTLNSIASGGNPSLGTVYDAKPVYKSDGKTVDYYIPDKTSTHEVYWNQINMLILGFADHYNSSLENNAGARTLITNYINAGKTALFTFDTTSDVRWSDSSSFYSTLASKAKSANGGNSIWYPYVGYNMSISFAGILGQDRFGVYKNRGLLESSNGKIRDIKEQVNDALGVASFDGINILSVTEGAYKNKNLKYDIPFLANKSMSLSTSNLATTTKKNSSNNDVDTDKTRVQVQGFTKNNIRTGAYSAAKTATRTNEGQIVKYPYEVGSPSLNGKNYQVTLSLAHAQWLQLNMEDDDIVVWFSLFSAYKTDSDGDVDTSKFDLTQNIINDGTNNYYIYSKGNVTFSGVGMASSALTEDEYKLFVNTMIASFRAQIQPTEPEILNSDKSKESDKDFLYVDYDATVPAEASTPIGSEIKSVTFGEGKTASAKRVMYMLRNESIVLDKTMIVNYYPVLYTTVTDSDGSTKDIKVVMYEYPMALDTRLIKGTDGNPRDDDPHVNREDNRVGSGFNDYTMPKDKSKTTMLENKGIGTVDDNQGKVDSGDRYWVDIPISDNYYKNLLQPKTGVLTVRKDGFGNVLDYTYTFKYTKKNGTEGTGTYTFTSLGLDYASDFEVEIQVAMRYGTNLNANDPLVGTRGIVFMRRGMFKLE